MPETVYQKRPFRYDLQLFTNGVEASGTSGDGGSSAGGSGTETGTSTGGSSVELSDEKIYGEKHVKKIHDENASYRHRNKELEAKVREYEEAKAAETQKKLEQDGEFKKMAEEAQKTAKKAESEAAKKIADYQKNMIRHNAKAMLVVEGILDPDDVALLDFSNVEWDDAANEATGLAEAIKAFKKAKPAKFKASETGGEESGTGKHRARQTTPSNGGAGGTGKSGDDARNWSKEQLDREWNSYSRV